MKTRPRVIVVMGPFRSGTSLASRILSMLGVDFGPPETMLKADRHNPDGYFQHRSIRIANNRLLRSAGASVALPADPDAIARDGNPVHLRRAKLDWHCGSSLWGMKDPRFCATLFSWLEQGLLADSDLCMVFLNRNIEATADDILHMPELSRQLAERTLESARATVARYKLLAAWHKEHVNSAQVTLDYDRLVESPEERISEFSESLGIGSRPQIKHAAACVRMPSLIG